MPLVIRGVLAGVVTNCWATITWSTDKPSDRQIEYGLTPA